MCKRSTRLVMDILSNPVFTIVPFALWAVLIAAAVCSLAAGGEGLSGPLRSARVILGEHPTRHDIHREEFADRRKALGLVTAVVRASLQCGEGPPLQATPATPAPS